MYIVKRRKYCDYKKKENKGLPVPASLNDSRQWKKKELKKFQRRKQCVKYSPMRGMAMCIKWACSWSCALPSSAWSPSRSFPRTSWGTLHPHPFKSANRVSRKVASRSCATGSKGLRNANAFGFPASSSWATDRASCVTGVPCRSAILL